MNTPAIITHNGHFHLDEVLACAILQKIYPGSPIIRTRDYKTIETMILNNEYIAVVDVYNQFDPTKNLFDHHQRSFNETFSEKYNIKLSSAGLVYKYKVDEFLKAYGIERNHLYDFLVDEIYKSYFLYADAVDNGYDINGSIRKRSMEDIIETFNDTAEQDEAFANALEFVKDDMERYMLKTRKWIKEYEKVESAVQECTGDVLIWKVDNQHSTNISGLVSDIEKKYSKDIKFLIIQGEACRIYTIPVAKNSFASKVYLCESWRGLRGNDLYKISGIKGIGFVHASGFTGSCQTLEGALEMCEKSLQM